MKLDNFTNLYRVNKTLRFKLVPVGKTLENFEKNGILIDDEKREENFLKVKALLDDCHRSFIDDCLSDYQLPKIDEYAKYYYSKDDGRKKALYAIQKEMRESISKQFSSAEDYKKLLGKEIIENILPKRVKTKEEAELVASFKGFATYFTGYHDNRKNMYTGKGNSTEIAYRIVDQNLPFYLDNCRTFKLINDETTIIKEWGMVGGEKPFKLENYSSFIRQSAIDKYNEYLGGYSIDENTKVQGLNEYINLYNQKNKTKYPKMKPLYKQVLSEKETISFIPESFENDNSVLSAIQLFYKGNSETNTIGFEETLNTINQVFSDIEKYNLSLIYINSNNLTDLSNKVFGSWSYLKEAIEEDYDNNSKAKDKTSEKYLEKRKKDLHSISLYSIAKLQELAKNKGSEKNIGSYIAEEMKELISIAKENYIQAKKMLENEYPLDKKLAKDDNTIELVKTFLDSLKDIQFVLKQYEPDDSVLEKDESFYSIYFPCLTSTFELTSLYNKVRNYLTKKPYSTNKFRLNFDNAQLFGGWDKNKEPDYRTVLFKKDGNYFVGIMTKESNRMFTSIQETKEGESVYQKMVYKLLPSPNKMFPKVCFSNNGVKNFKPSEQLQKDYENRIFRDDSEKGRKALADLIDYYKYCINNYESWAPYNFKLKETNEYKSLEEFYADIEEQNYMVNFVDVPESFININVDAGNLYLFKIYSKDFSEKSKGKKNLQTLYFDMLFDERNLKDVVYKLDGQAEMYYRKPSIKLEQAVVHKAGIPIDNKNTNNPKKTTTLDHDVIKDKRYTEPHFQFHVKLRMNYKAKSNADLNGMVRQQLKEDNNNYVIGIDRGERNLIDICVIDSKGKIVEQKSLNLISSNYDGIKYTTDYHSILESREKKRDEARKSWKTIEGIKDLKEGYISQVVHEIVTLVEKYNAVIGLEDLNSGFKNSRKKVEKQVYQNFEKALITKLNYYVNKNTNPEENGGLLNAYQLTEKFESFAKMKNQNGILFYIPAWLTSKIDPTTGFVDLLHPKYKNVEDAKDFFSRFDSISFNKDEDLFEFEIDYDNFDGGTTDYNKKWTICSYGKRIRTFRNKDKNSEWDNEEIDDLTLKFKELFKRFDIDYTDNLKEKIMSKNEKEFFEQLIRLLSLTLQMRNSITGTSTDYLISPVRNKDGKFYNSNDYSGDNAPLPTDADSNGAYHIALKTMWAIEQIKKAEDDEIGNVKLAISKLEWLKYAQNRNK